MVADAARNDLERIRPALTEASANVVRHAYPGDHGMLDVGVCRGPKMVMIEVRDCGVGVPGDRQPRAARGGGLGLPLIDMLIDQAEITPRPQGTSVRMTVDLH